MKSEGRSLAVVLALTAAIPSNVVLASTVYDPDITDYSAYNDVTHTEYGYNYTFPENNNLQIMSSKMPPRRPLLGLTALAASSITENAQVRTFSSLPLST